MAFPTALNSQITDSVTQANLKVLGDSPALSSGELYVATSQALANAAHNATVIQNETQVTAQTAMTAGVGNILVTETAADGKATQAALGANVFRGQGGISAEIAAIQAEAVALGL